MMFVNKIPSIIILFVLVLCLILLAILISTSESYIVIHAQLILDKIKGFLIIINFWNTLLDAIIMHHIISCHSSVHSVASWSGICRLTNGYAFEYHFVGCLYGDVLRTWAGIIQVVLPQSLSSSPELWLVVSSDHYEIIQRQFLLGFKQFNYTELERVTW